MLVQQKCCTFIQVENFMYVHIDINALQLYFLVKATEVAGPRLCVVSLYHFGENQVKRMYFTPMWAGASSWIRKEFCSFGKVHPCMHFLISYFYPHFFPALFPSLGSYSRIDPSVWESWLFFLLLYSLLLFKYELEGEIFRVNCSQTRATSANKYLVSCLSSTWVIEGWMFRHVTCSFDWILSFMLSTFLVHASFIFKYLGMKVVWMIFGWIRFCMRIYLDIDKNLYIRLIFVFIFIKKMKMDMDK